MNSSCSSSVRLTASLKRYKASGSVERPFSSIRFHSALILSWSLFLASASSLRLFSSSSASSSRISAFIRWCSAFSANISSCLFPISFSIASCSSMLARKGVEYSRKFVALSHIWVHSRAVILSMFGPDSPAGQTTKPPPDSHNESAIRVGASSPILASETVAQNARGQSRSTQLPLLGKATMQALWKKIHEEIGTTIIRSVSRVSTFVVHHITDIMECMLHGLVDVFLRYRGDAPVDRTTKREHLFSSSLEKITFLVR